MNSNWLNAVDRDTDGANEGLRPSFAEILAVVDANDPAIVQIAQVLRDARDAGAELDAAAAAEAVRIGRQRHADRQPEPQLEDPEPVAPAFKSIVYYTLHRHLVKIGTTLRPEERFSGLMPDRILAVEPGDRKTEQERHGQFRHLRIGTSEYFEQGPDLVSHIATVREEHGAPNPAWRSIETIDRPRVDFHFAPPPATSAEVVTASEGADRLGVQRGTARGWVHRKLLRPVGKNDQGRAVYFLDDMRFLADRSAAVAQPRVARHP